MRKFVYSLVFLILFCNGIFVCANEPEETKSALYQPFTGRVKSNRVRVRTEPHTNSHILNEINRGELFVVVDEIDDFYVVLPPKWVNAFVYRTFVIDNVIEGNKVNVRTAPTLEAPIIAQLNTGDKIEGLVSSQNNRWLKIKAPDSTRFYISKVFIENVGSPDYIQTMEKKQQDVDYLLISAKKMGQEELEKDYDDIQLDETYGYLDKIIQEYTEFPNQIVQAKKMLQEFQQSYLQKKIAYLEDRAKQIANSFQSESPLINEEIRIHQQQLSEVEKKLQQNETELEIIAEAETGEIQPQRHNAEMTAKMASWFPLEENHYLKWLESKEDRTLSRDQYYHEERQHAKKLRGVLELYSRAVNNKPGDFILVDRSTRLPIAYLYSTKVNLLELVGKEVAVTASARPDNNFAFPAYFVLEVN